VAEVPVQAHAHGNALLPQVDEEHRPEHLGLELRAINPGEHKEYRALREADGVHGSARYAHHVQAIIFHEPGRGERLRLRHLGIRHQQNNFLLLGYLHLFRHT